MPVNWPWSERSVILDVRCKDRIDNTDTDFSDNPEAMEAVEISRSGGRSMELAPSNTSKSIPSSSIET